MSGFPILIKLLFHLKLWSGERGKYLAICLRLPDAQESSQSNNSEWPFRAVGLSQDPPWAVGRFSLHHLGTADLFLLTLHSWTALETEVCCASTDLRYKGDFLD